MNEHIKDKFKSETHKEPFSESNDRFEPTGTFSDDYVEWLESKVNNSVLDDVMALFKPHELWRMAQKYNCDDFTQMIEQSKRLNKL